MPQSQIRVKDVVAPEAAAGDGPEAEENTQRAVRYCLEQPEWRLSLQTHKLQQLAVTYRK